MTTQRSNSAALVIGAFLIGFGLLALFGQFFAGFHFWTYFWPLVVIGIGGLFFIGMLAGGKQVAGLAIPGSIIMVSGITLFFQNLTGSWSTWSYGWTITLASVGLGIFIMGLYQGDGRRREAGLKVMQVAAVLFIIFGAFFELFLLPFGVGRGGYLFPVLLILLGAYLVLSRAGLIGWPKPTDQDPKPGASL